jgi:sugar porter (SP) family MFS transporter
LAGLVTSPIASYVSDKKGRLVSMAVAAVFFLVGSGLNAGAQDLAMLYIGRVCLGAGIGFANASVPVYLSEAAPFKYRGALNQLFQLATTIGIFVAQLVNYGVRNWAAGWRLSLGLAAVPALVLLFGSLILPESPNSLYQRGHVDRAEQVLKRLRKSDDVSAELDDIREATRLCAENSTLDSWRQLGKRKNMPQLVISILVPFFQQFTGINAIMFYVPVLFKSLGSGADEALLNTVIIGCVNVVATLVCIELDRRALASESDRSPNALTLSLTRAPRSFVRSPGRHFFRRQTRSPFLVPRRWLADDGVHDNRGSSSRCRVLGRRDGAALSDEHRRLGGY